MRWFGFKLVLITFACSLLGCESSREVFGNKKVRPDEFLVYKRPPLSQPPDYGLRPPQQGTQEKRISPERMAKAAIIGVKAESQLGVQPLQTSPGMQSLLRNTGALTASSSIRGIISEETSIYADEDERFVDKLIFWVDDQPFEGTVLNPKEEQKRIRNAQALGKPITDGKTSHVKRQRKKKGLLEF